MASSPPPRASWTAQLTIVTVAILFVVIAETVALVRGPMALTVLAALPVAFALFHLTVTLRERAADADEEPASEMENGPAEMLYHWRARAQMLADRSEGTRADWDRHLRPLLAKEFESSAGLRVAKDRKATEAAGVLQFGPELWRWVDPANSALRDQASSAPGRAALEEILRRLQRM
ncbi:hypothetical protein [Nocardia bovistercoris]|uniref:Uncharacterized protein n=1 Tax=Nocardia bovistercoris TaxID=2785916 RepID=A0A931N4Q1_9NOCA|nr:hypothetical protein [Nocardia bovistercoris]MBH0778506.1 hypothetical protein [Nocardia bovistercoris]